VHGSQSDPAVPICMGLWAEESGCREMVVLYPLEFYRRHERQGKPQSRQGKPQSKRRVEAVVRFKDGESSPERGGECCPNCCLPVATPFVSTYLREGVEHYWRCKTCEFDWNSRIPPLLI
jgi:hypothetical protein